MSEVVLHVYDVTNTPSDNTNTAIKSFNSVTRDVMGVGGVFHGGVEINGAEWSYGFCEEGTGVYICEPKKNPMYTYRWVAVTRKFCYIKRQEQEKLKDVKVDTNESLLNMSLNVADQGITWPWSHNTDQC